MLQEQSPISRMLKSRGIELSEPCEDRSTENLILNESVNLLWHTDANDDEKLIGVYRTKADALAAIERVKSKPGFAEEGGRFEIAEYALNEDHWTEGFERPVD
jgi:hypothetical protein